jgi:sugar O-acyltransferase (sialic acid O-acetyltransferase NeuD family)
MARLVIFGTGDIARLAHFYFTRDSEHEVVAFTVDAEYRHGDRFAGLPLVDAAAVTTLYPPAQYAMFVAIGYTQMNRARAAKYEQMKASGYTLMSYVSSRCSYLSESLPGDNCFILEDNTIQPFVTIGNDVVLWSGNHVGHDAVIEDHCFITSHVVISGHAKVRPYCFIGVNATIRNAIEIAPATLIGAGAVIMKGTKPKGVYLPQRAELFSKTSDQIEI